MLVAIEVTLTDALTFGSILFAAIAALLNYLDHRGHNEHIGNATHQVEKLANSVEHMADVQEKATRQRKTEWKTLADTMRHTQDQLGRFIEIVARRM